MSLLCLGRRLTKLGKLCVNHRSMSTSTKAVAVMIDSVEVTEETKKQIHDREVEKKKGMKAFFEKFVDRLPNLSSPSHYKVECVNTAKEADTKLTKLLKETPVKVFGVDFEWPPCFVKGKPENKIALIQICSSKKILLIQVGQMKELPLELMNFFESKDFLKTGVNIKMDGLKLYRDFGIRTNGLVELMTMVKSSKNPLLEKIHLRSLRALTAIYLKQKMGKGKVRTSNWAAPFLNAKQKQYAALDAYASYTIYRRLVAEGIIYNDIEHLDEHLAIPHPTETAEVIQTKIEKKIEQTEMPESVRKRGVQSTTTVIKRSKKAE